MTYLQFHLVYNLPLVAVLSWLAWPTWCEEDWFATAVTAVIVVAYTSPWDNWAIRHGLWNFPQDRILGRILYCPVEEYAFFIIQTVQGCLLAHVLNWKWVFLPAATRGEPNWLVVVLILLLWVAVGVAKRLAILRLPRRWTYFWHLLFWMLPIVILQWAIGGVWIGNPLVVLATTVVLGTILCLFDAVAIARGIWHFSETQTVSWRIAGVLPVEEALFFYLTSLLVVQSYLLWL